MNCRIARLGGFCYATIMDKKRVLSRSIRLLHPPNGEGIGMLCLTNRRKHAFYMFKEIPCAIGGRGFTLWRLDKDQRYCVRVGKPEESSCECLGFLAHGHCKHIDGIRILMEQAVI
jgi:hypothetical protein